ncbi:MAG: hypothetical protein IJ778_04260 [Alphaproteobacteria bacterium]|nr:hypothetical protein [Alphaproteobacteria bacterium]
MFITQCYKYEKDGIVYVGGNVPEDATILETMDILNAEEGFDIIRIADNENMGNSVWLKDGDVQENYKEVKSETVGE